MEIPDGYLNKSSDFKMEKPLLFLFLSFCYILQQLSFTSCMNTQAEEEHEIDRLIADIVSKGFAKDVDSQSSFKFDAHCKKCQVYFIRGQALFTLRGGLWKL